MRIAEKVLDRICLVFGVFAAIGALMLMFVTTYDVFMRVVFNAPGTGTYEIAQYTFCLVFFGALVWCAHKHRYLHVTLLVTKLPKKPGMAIWAFFELLSCATCFYLSYACYLQSISMKQQHLSSTVLLIPNTPFYYFGTVCMFVFSLRLLLDTVKAFAAIFNDEYAAEIRSGWD